MAGGQRRGSHLWREYCFRRFPCSFHNRSWARDLGGKCRSMRRPRGCTGVRRKLSKRRRWSMVFLGILPGEGRDQDVPRRILPYAGGRRSGHILLLGGDVCRLLCPLRKHGVGLCHSTPLWSTRRPDPSGHGNSMGPSWCLGVRLASCQRPTLSVFPCPISPIRIPILRGVGERARERML